MVRHGSKNKLKKTRVTKRLDWVYEPYGGTPVSSNTPVENLEVRVNVKIGQLKVIKVGIEIISTSCTRSSIRSWFLFSITYNHKTNH